MDQTDVGAARPDPDPVDRPSTNDVDRRRYLLGYNNNRPVRLCASCRERVAAERAEQLRAVIQGQLRLVDNLSSPKDPVGLLLALRMLVGHTASEEFQGIAVIYLEAVAGYLDITVPAEPPATPKTP